MIGFEAVTVGGTFILSDDDDDEVIFGKLVTTYKQLTNNRGSICSTVGTLFSYYIIWSKWYKMCIDRV